MFKIFNIFLLMMIMNTITAQSTKIIAHRGAWKEFNLPENSIEALEKAIELNCYGAEFDVRRTLDGVLIVNHDPVYFGDTIQTNTYAYLNRNKLLNGESLPTLEQYFIKGTKNNQSTLLICEIKEAVQDKKQDYLTTLATLDLAKKMKIENKLVYISFSQEILQWIKEKQPNATVLYLESNLTIDEVVRNQFDGINWHYTAFKTNTELAESARKMKLKTGSWTVNELSDFQLLMKQGVELITTNHPLQFQQYLKALKEN